MGITYPKSNMGTGYECNYATAYPSGHICALFVQSLFDLLRCSYGFMRLFIRVYTYTCWPLKV
jgi:hypothetical protein